MSSLGNPVIWIFWYYYYKKLDCIIFSYNCRNIETKLGNWYENDSLVFIDWLLIIDVKMERFLNFKYKE